MPLSSIVWQASAVVVFFSTSFFSYIKKETLTMSSSLMFNLSRPAIKSTTLSVFFSLSLHSAQLHGGVERYTNEFNWFVFFVFPPILLLSLAGVCMTLHLLMP